MTLTQRLQSACYFPANSFWTACHVLRAGPAQTPPRRQKRNGFQNIGFPRTVRPEKGHRLCPYLKADNTVRAEMRQGQRIQKKRHCAPFQMDKNTAAGGIKS